MALLINNTVRVTTLNGSDSIKASLLDLNQWEEKMQKSSYG